MENKKGLTLIELLATIVVIGVVSLIVVPVVNNIIKQSRKATFKSSLEGIYKVSSNYYISNSTLIEDSSFMKFECDSQKKECVAKDETNPDFKQKLDIKGNPGNGYIKIYSSGEIEFLLSNDNYCGVKYPNKENIDIYEGDCSEVIINSYIITFDGNGGEVDTVSKVVLDGSLYGELPVPSRSGYRFIGWYTEKDNGEKIDDTMVAIITQNQTLFAHWRKDSLENKTYTTGEAVTLGGYKWHVVGDTGSQVTLLMDASQLDDNSNMKHCTNDTDASTDCGYNGSSYVYSWDKSLIRTYLNSTLLSELESKISNTIVSTLICADPSTGDGSTTYGGYLMSELSALGKTSSCTSKVSDKIRLITSAEYYNMTPYYTTTNSNYPNVQNITRLSSSSNYSSWLYCSTNTCGNSSGEWWTMNSIGSGLGRTFRWARHVRSNGNERVDLEDGHNATDSLGVRPVITIVK